MSEIINGANMNKAGVYPGWKAMAQAEHDKITIEPLTVTENDTYTAPAGKAYNPVNVNVAGGGEPDNLLTLHLSLEMPEGVAKLKCSASMVEFENKIVLATDGASFYPLDITESQTDLKVYGLPFLADIGEPPEQTYTGTINGIPFFIGNATGSGPYFDSESSVYTHCSWDSDRWTVVFDEGYTEASLEVKFTETPPY